MLGFLQRTWTASHTIQQGTLLRSFLLPVTSWPSRAYHPPQSYGVDNANARVFDDLRNVYQFTQDVSPELHILSSLQTRFHEWTVTMASASTGLLEYAKAGEAVAILDTQGPNLLSKLKYEPAEYVRSAQEHRQGEFREQVEFGRYDYQWKGRSFIVYLLCRSWYEDMVWDSNENAFFILHRREGDKIQDGRSVAARELIAASASHSAGLDEGDVMIFDDDVWKKDTKLWKRVQNTKWDDVILDQSLKDGRNLLRPQKRL